MYGEPLRPRVLRVRCEGFRERRDLAIGEEARALAAEVRRSGEPRTLEPMNAYERRIVHVALQDEADVRTFSVGEGAERRVTIARAEPGPAVRRGRRRRRPLVRTGRRSRPSGSRDPRSSGSVATSTPWPPGARAST